MHDWKTTSNSDTNHRVSQKTYESLHTKEPNRVQKEIYLTVKWNEELVDLHFWLESTMQIWNEKWFFPFSQTSSQTGFDFQNLPFFANGASP